MYLRRKKGKDTKERRCYDRLQMEWKDIWQIRKLYGKKVVISDEIRGYLRQADEYKQKVNEIK